MKEIQNKIREFCSDNNMESATEIRIFDLLSELGEVSKELLKNTDYGKKEFQRTNNFEMELGDLFFSLIALANTCNIDLENALLLALEKYTKRLVKGSAGSEND